ncbi:MAG: PID-CTERM protein-sorting domain-containing protein [Flavipsychrobacter sp.]
MKHLRIITAYIFFMMMSITASAQGPGFDDDVVDEVPIDGGVSALVVAGIAYGVKKLKEQKKER